MSIHTFCEGKTEEKVLDHIRNLDLYPKMEHCHGKGKSGINQRLVATIAPKIGKPETLRCLVMRDLDAHDGETIGTIVQSLTDALKRKLPERGMDVSSIALVPHPEWSHVFTLASTTPDFLLALHVAAHPWKDDFIKSTIDDCVLRLALDPVTAERLAGDLNLEGSRLVRKITRELPRLLDENGIPLLEAKDYVRLYAAVVKSHTSPPVFAEKTMKRAEESTIREIFAPLLAAIDFIHPRPFASGDVQCE
jgi:hypothetical protein